MNWVSENIDNFGGDSGRVTIIALKGKLGDFFLFVQSFYWPKTKTSFNRQFSPKRPKLVKNQAKGSEIHQIRTKWHPSYCGNPSILSSDLAVKIKRSLQGSPVENKMLRSWMFWLKGFGRVGRVGGVGGVYILFIGISIVE